MRLVSRTGERRSRSPVFVCVRFNRAFETETERQHITLPWLGENPDQIVRELPCLVGSEPQLQLVLDRIGREWLDRFHRE